MYRPGRKPDNPTGKLAVGLYRDGKMIATGHTPDPGGEVVVSGPVTNPFSYGGTRADFRHRGKILIAGFRVPCANCDCWPLP